MITQRINGGNHLNELKKLNKEDLTQRLDRHLDWIKSCDTKASIVIAGEGNVQNERLLLRRIL